MPSCSSACTLLGKGQCAGLEGRAGAGAPGSAASRIWALGGWQGQGRPERAASRIRALGGWQGQGRQGQICLLIFLIFFFAPTVYEH